MPIGPIGPIGLIRLISPIPSKKAAHLSTCRFSFLAPKGGRGLYRLWTYPFGNYLLLRYCKRLAPSCTCNGDLCRACSTRSWSCYCDFTITFSATWADCEPVFIACHSPFILGCYPASMVAVQGIPTLTSASCFTIPLSPPPNTLP